MVEVLQGSDFGASIYHALIQLPQSAAIARSCTAIATGFSPRTDERPDARNSRQRIRTAPVPALPQTLDRLDCLEPRRLDAGHRRHLVDDRAHAVAAAHRA